MFKKFATTLTTVSATLAFAGSAFAEEHAMAMGGHNEFTVKAAIALAIGFGLAIAAAMGAIGQSKAATAALEGIARNPGSQDKVFVPMILGLALIESLVIYSLVISFMLLGKI